MRRFLIVALSILLSALLVIDDTGARDQRRTDVRVRRDWSEDEYAADLAAMDPGMQGLYTAAAVDTYLLVKYDFESNDWQGWTRFDQTAQRGVFFHADDFDCLGGGFAPLEGQKSIWCGARPDASDPYLCRWDAAPGYGNNWKQYLVSDHVTFSTRLDISYTAHIDLEHGYDSLYVEYEPGDGSWCNLMVFSGDTTAAFSHRINVTGECTVRIRFRVTSDGAWSDEDGLYPSTGAAIIDAISLSGPQGGEIDYEDFECWTIGATEDAGSIWHAEIPDGYGFYSGLWNNFQEFDPCGSNFGTQVVFFVGSPIMSSWYPGTPVTPFCEGPGGVEAPCQREMVISPIIEMNKYSTAGNEVQDMCIPAEDRPNLAGVKLKFTLFGDLPLANLVFYNWAVRGIDENGCPRYWEDRSFANYRTGGYYYYISQDVSDLVGGEERIQVSLMCLDLCDIWYLSYGNCVEHTPSPIFDNVRVYRYSKAGPQWQYRALDLFQDNFPEDEFDLESWVRADQANDLMPCDNPIIRPGDSMTVWCNSPLGGGLRDNGIGAEIYLHCRATDMGPLGKPALYGPELEGSHGTYVSDDGEWTIIQCDSARSASGYVSTDRWAVDLNDSLLTRGYIVEYYFSAVDNAGVVSTLPLGGGGAGAGPSLATAPPKTFEFTCLPTGKSYALYVDDYHGIGCHEGIVELYFNQTFEAIIPAENQPDRYDVNQPTSLVSNGLGGRAKLNHIKMNGVDNAGYCVIIWDSGDLDVGTITDGLCGNDKSNDAQLLIDWLAQSDCDPGLWISGDGIASELDKSPTPQAAELLSYWGGVHPIDDSYFDLTGGRYSGGVVNPLVTGTPEGIFGTSLEFHVFGGCPTINDFDALEPVNGGVAALAYPDYGGSPYYAAIQSDTTNSTGHTAKVMSFGFSFMYIRDTDVHSPIVRNEILHDFWLWSGIAGSDITEDDIPKAYELAQNFPNPFNPVTTIRFDIRKKGHVRLRIYNVAGQLVKTLVDDVMDPGSYTSEWTGVNNAGAEVASGVYFYRLEAAGYENVKKMVLLR
jgi:hypothetical protein